MDIDNMIYTGGLDATFPLPADRPFTFATAIEAGIQRRDLTRLCDEGILRRPIKRVYLPTQLGDSLALRAACLELVIPDDCVVVDRHAGWLLGAEMVLRPREHLDVRPLSVFRPSGHGRLRNDLSASGERNLSSADVIELHGMRVTTPLRTAWDLGRVRWTDEAISGLDSVFRLGSFERDEFLAGIERFRRMRWVTTLRAIGPHADGRSESPGESVLRLRCIECNVRMRPQVEVYRDGLFIARLDLADEDLMLAVEYDGVEWHRSPEQAARDQARRTALAEAGWTVLVFGAEQVFGRARECDSVIRSAVRVARAQRGLRVTS